MLEQFLKEKLSLIKKGNTNLKQNEVLDSIIDSLDDKEAKIANRLTLMRLPLGLAIPITAYFTKNDLATLALSTMYIASDFLDGFYAKTISKPTEGGKYMDAICDKIGALELILPASIQNPYLLINGALEAIIGKVNYEAIKDNNEVNSTTLGKLKMIPLSLGILSTYMSLTGLNLGKIKISKETFNKISLAVIPITALFEIINIEEYRKMKKHQLN